MKVEVVIEDPRWQDGGLEALAIRAGSAILAHLGLGQGYEVSLLGCDDTRIAELNREFLGKARPTNVLSWPAEEHIRAQGGHPTPPNGQELGDIAIAWETCAREALEQDKAFEDHVLHLLVHATLHLLGYDHINEKDAALMEGLEVEILGKEGVSDPYWDIDG